MSHIVEINFYIDNFDHLTSAFAGFGWEIKQNCKARTYRNDPLRDIIYDYVAVNPTGSFDLGIKLENGEYKIFGDFYDRTIAFQLGDQLSQLKVSYNLTKAKQFLDDEELEYQKIETDDILELKVTI